MRSILDAELDYFVGDKKFKTEKAAQKYADKIGHPFVQSAPRASKGSVFRIQ